MKICFAIPIFVILSLKICELNAAVLNEQFDAFPNYFNIYNENEGGTNTVLSTNVSDGILSFLTDGLSQDIEIELRYPVSSADTQTGILYFTVEAGNSAIVTDGGTFIDEDGDLEAINQAVAWLAFSSFSGDDGVALQNHNGRKRITFGDDSYIEVNEFDKVYLRLSYDFNTSITKQYYSTDGSNFIELHSSFAPNDNFSISLGAESNFTTFNEGEVYFDNFVISDDINHESSLTDDLPNVGSVITWGVFNRGGDSSSVASELSSGVTAIYSTNGAFAALKDDGSVVTWGQSNTWGLINLGGDSSSVASELSSGVSSIYSNSSAFAALKEDGSVVTWGRSDYGGDSSSVASELSSTVTAIYSTNGAFAALKDDGSVVTWGRSDGGGDSSSVASELSSGVSTIYSTDGTFAALKEDGSVVTWGTQFVASGTSDYGGVLISAASELSSGVSTIYSNTTAFAALKEDGSVVTWGLSNWGGDSSSVASELSSGVSTICSNTTAFAALKDDGSVVTWGDIRYGGDSSSVASKLSSGISAIYSSLYAFAALKDDGSVVTWGLSDWGGDSSNVTSELSSGISTIYSSIYAFAALKEDASVVTWGRSERGGDSSSVASELSGGVTAIYSTHGAFAALKDDGSVVTWGVADEADSSSVAPALSSGVIAITSNNVAFAALKVLLPPVIPILKNFYESTIGTTIEIDATPVDGYPVNYTYQWYFNGFPVPPMFGGTNSAYTINGSESSNGTWRVEVTNDAGTTSAEFEYRVFSDADGDGLSDYRESNILSTNPNDSDTDFDGLNDYDEVITYLTDPNVSDSDSDGLGDGAEVNTYSTNPLDSDSDDDGLSDGVEVSTHLTDPTDADSDDDGLSDGAEISTHLTNPNSSDSDSDGLSDGEEIGGLFIIVTNLDNVSDWNTAKFDAENKGGRLAVLDTEQKMNKVKAMLQNLSEWPYLYIGLSYSNEKSNWEWVNGEVLDFNNWAPGEPNFNLSTYGAVWIYSSFDQPNRWPLGSWNNDTFIRNDFFPISYLLEISSDPNDADSDDDGLNDGIEINTYSSNPLTADTSGDGFNDGFIVGEGLNPTSDYSALRSSTISNVVSDSEAYGLYALDNIQDLRPGSTMIEVSENQATVQLQMEESSDLQTWEDTGTPATMTIPADTDTKFFRFKMAE